MIDQIFAIEREINGRTAVEHLSVRPARVAPLVHALQAWMWETCSNLSRHDALAKAIAYPRGRSQWVALEALSLRPFDFAQESLVALHVRQTGYAAPLQAAVQR
jgi:hypothetical protein